MWKQRANLMKASNGNLLLPGQALKQKSIKSINGSSKSSKKMEVEKSSTQPYLTSLKNISNDSCLSPAKSDNYFKSGKFIAKRMMSEDEFFDN
jgi:hypothetical protein